MGAKIALKNEFLGNKNFERVATDLRSFQDGRRIPSDAVDAFVICLQLVYRDLIAEEHLHGFDISSM